MPVVSAEPITSTSLNMLVCVDTHDDDKIGGTLYNQFIPEPFEFRDIISLTGKMDEIFDTFSFPQPFFSVRTFGAKQARRSSFQKGGIRHMSREDMFENRGEKGTFLISVQFRQNATWQGTISWMDQNKKQHFRSALEMLKLMDEALGSDASEDSPPEWQ